MRLLVSVANASEAREAVAGSADIIDAKDPATGPLGAVSGTVFRTICTAVGTSHPLTAAIGDVALDDASDDDICARTRAFAAAGARLVKVGFAGLNDPARVESALAHVVAAWRRAVPDRQGGVVAVAYADAEQVGSLAPEQVCAAAVRAGAAGILLDTADKRGPGLLTLWNVPRLTRWTARAHAQGLLVALAGKLTSTDLSLLPKTGADIIGVRGAACVGGRTGRVTAYRVADLVALCGATTVGCAR